MSGRAFSLPIPIGFESLNPVADLTDRVGRDGPLFAIRLWQHRQRTGALVAGENAAGIIERLAGWTRKRGVLASALVAAGIVEQAKDGLRIVDPFKLGSVEWMGGRFSDDDVAPEVSGLAPDDRAKRYEAARKRIKRDKSLSTAERDAAFESLRRQFGVGGEQPDTTGQQPDTTGQQPDTTGQQPDNGRTTTGQQPPSQDKERAYTPVTGPLPVPVPDASEEQKHLSVSVSETDTAGRKPNGLSKSNPKADATEATITEVLEHWREVVWLSKDGNRSVAIVGAGSDKRRSRIRSRLAEGRTAEELKQVANGALHSDWHMGRDPKAPDGFRDVETLFRDDSQVEKFIGYARNPPKRKPTGRQLYDPKTTVYDPAPPALLAEIGIL